MRASCSDSSGNGENEIIDYACLPFRRWGLYLFLLLPFLLCLALIFTYLWEFSPLLSFIYVAFFIVLNVVQGYCCLFQSCPYVGGVCPAIYGIIPASFIGGLLQERVQGSKRVFYLLTFIGIFSIFALALFPVYWLSKKGMMLAIGYPLFFVIYTLLHLILICPACAMRYKCSASKLLDYIYRHH